MLARLDDNPRIARRFEFVVDGLELANGYFELKDWSEHLKRFSIDNDIRLARGLPKVNIDNELLNDPSGIPDCAGVAMGFDRLLMLKIGETDIGSRSCLG